jgi:hypothetical protein
MVSIKYFLLLASLAPYLAAAEQLNDPTRPVGYSAPVSRNQIEQVSPAKTIPEWTLNTTLVSQYQKIAMINGKRLQVGDVISGAEVVKIDHQKVDLLREGKIFTIKLYNSFISEVKSSLK